MPQCEAAVREALAPQIASYEAARLGAKKESKQRGAAGRGERLQSRLAGRGEDRRLPRGQVACAQGGELRRRAGGPHGERRQQRQERGRGGAQADRRGVRPLEEARRTAAAAKVRVGRSNVRGCFEALSVQMQACEREHEYANSGLPSEAAGRSSACVAGYAAGSGWAVDRTEHPTFVASLAQLCRAFQSAAGNGRWMKEAKIKEHFVKLTEEKKADAAASKADAAASKADAAASKADAAGAVAATSKAEGGDGNAAPAQTAKDAAGGGEGGGPANSVAGEAASRQDNKQTGASSSAAAMDPPTAEAPAPDMVHELV